MITVFLFHSSALASGVTTTPSNPRQKTDAVTALKTLICFFSFELFATGSSLRRNTGFGRTSAHWSHRC